MYPYYLYIPPSPPKRKKIVPIIVIIAIFIVVVFVMTNNSSSDCIGNWSSCSATCGCGTNIYNNNTENRRW